MKFLAALASSLAVMAAAAPAIAQPSHGHGSYGGHGGGHGDGGPHWEGGERGGYGGPRGGYAEPRGGAYAQPRGAYPEPHGGYPEPNGYRYPVGPRGYGYAPGAPPGYERQGPDSLGGWRGQQDEVRAGVRQGRYIGLARVIGSIRRRTPGRQLDAGLEQWGGRTVYRVRWAEPGGRRVDYIVDAQSGAILHVDGR